MRETLTKQQENILENIKKFIKENGYSPTIRELCKLCNLKSTATMFVHIQNLQDKGYINSKNGKMRTITIIESEMK